MRGMPPKRASMVSTGRASNSAAMEAIKTAISIPGQPGRQCLKPRMTPIVSNDTKTAAVLMVSAAPRERNKLWRQLPRFVAVQRQAEEIM